MSGTGHKRYLLRIETRYDAFPLGMPYLSIINRVHLVLITFIYLVLNVYMLVLSVVVSKLDEERVLFLLALRRSLGHIVYGARID